MNKLTTRPQPSFPEAVKGALHKTLDFNTRTRRSDFWWFMLAFFICYFFLSNISIAFLPPIASTLCNLGISFFALAITARRLQDCGASKWWVIVSYVATIISNIYIYASGIEDELQSINGSEQALAHIFTDPIFIILHLVVAVTSLVIFIYCLCDGKPFVNKYGPSPKYIITKEFTEVQT